MKKKTNLQTKWLERTTFDSTKMLQRRRTVKTQPLVGGTKRRPSLAELLDYRERLEVEAYQTEALRSGALGVRWGASVEPDAQVAEEATARLLRVAQEIERVDSAIRRLG